MNSENSYLTKCQGTGRGGEECVRYNRGSLYRDSVSFKDGFLLLYLTSSIHIRKYKAKSIVHRSLTRFSRKLTVQISKFDLQTASLPCCRLWLGEKFNLFASCTLIWQAVAVSKRVTTEKLPCNFSLQGIQRQ